MNDFKLVIKEIILQNTNSFLLRLRDSAIIPFNEFEKWKDVYKNFFHKNYGIMFINKEEIKNPPNNYFRVYLYHSDPEKTRKNLIENYDAIKSRYSNLDMFIPVKYFEKLIDEGFSHKKYDFVHLNELCYQKNIKWDLNLMRKFKKLSILHGDQFNINSLTNVKLNFDYLEEFKDSITWDDIIYFKELRWDISKLKKYADYIVFENNDSTWSPRDGSFSLLLNTKWDFNTISTLIDYWNFSELCLNKNIDWNSSLINNFLQKVDFESLSSNTHIKWNFELIEEFKDRWNWQKLSGNPSLPWSTKLLEEYNSRWKWNVEFNNYNETRNKDKEVESNYLPSISTNPGIIWNAEMIDLGKQQIDYWRLARRGNLSLDVVKIIKEELYRKELIGWRFHEYSDFMTVTEKIYVTGWENLAKNHQFKLNPEIIVFLYNNKITLTYSVGNLNNDGDYLTTEFKLIEIFKNSTFVNEDYIKHILHDNDLKSFFINNDFINGEIWEKIIKPYTLKNKKELLNTFRKIKGL